MTVTRFQQKRGTSAQWAASTTPLRDGEFGIDKDTGIIKVGDGLTLWPQLPIAFNSQYLPLLGKAHDSYRLEGLQAADFLRSTGKAVSAADSDKLGGQAPAFYMPASAAGSFLPIAGKAADADKLDGLDSTAFLPVSATAADAAKLGGNLPSYFAKASDVVGNYMGAMTSFPVSGMTPASTVIRSDIGTSGSLWQYIGPGKGSSGWVHKGPIVCTSSTRPPSSGASSVAYGGLEIFESDTGRSYRWLPSGSPIDSQAFGLRVMPTSLWDQFAGPPEVYPFNYGSNPFQDLINTSAGWVPTTVYKMGRNVWMDGDFASASGVGNNLTAGTAYNLGTVSSAVKPTYHMQTLGQLWAPGRATAVIYVYNDGSVTFVPYSTASSGWSCAFSGLHWLTLA